MKWLVLAALVGVAACGGGGDEGAGDAGGGGGSPDGGAPDAGGDAAPDPGGCGLGAADKVGEVCTADADCGPGGRCLVLEGQEGARCYRICLPGACVESCEAVDDCVRITDPGTGMPRTLDDGRVLGACLPPLDGTAGPYEACGTNVTCVDGLLCLNFGGDPTSTCAPPCAGDACEAPAGFTAACVLRVGDGMEPTHCAITCEDTAASSDCPAGMRCRAGGQLDFCSR